jgi:hypothetical protein
MKVYYLKQEFLEMMIDTEKISKGNINRTHTEMPDVIADLHDPDEVFLLLNNGADIPNPYNSPGIQKFIGVNKIHTSMSVGDVVEIDGVYWLCENTGWRTL